MLISRDDCTSEKDPYLGCSCSLAILDKYGNDQPAHTPFLEFSDEKTENQALEKNIFVCWLHTYQ